MKHLRLVCASVILLMLVVCMGAGFRYGKRHITENKNYYAQLSPAPAESDPLAYINEEFIAEQGFTSHLPIIILDTGGTEPPVNTYYLASESRYADIPDMDPYVNGTFILLDNQEGKNSLSDEPVISSSMRIKRRGNSSMFFEKAQWMIKLTTASGQDNEQDLLGMGEEQEWILNGSMFDKSMIRNYLANRIASEFMPFTSDSRFCEVLFKNGSVYEYQGVYLLMESIKQGKDRVNIAEYKETDTFNSYLVRRDRLDDGANTLETYGRLQGFCKEYMSLLYPSKARVTREMTAYVQKDINEIEKILYSEEPDIFYTYPEVIDVDSFVDYFLVNEFFGSYDAGNHSTYFYKDVGGKLTMGPVWDFDMSMDNYIYEPLSTGDLAFQTKPWFDRLCKDDTFLDKLEKRYIQLRRTSLSEQHINAVIDETIAYLGGARIREWNRWGHWYTTENRYSLQNYTQEDGTILYRNATHYYDEIYRIKAALQEHGTKIPGQIEYLRQSAVFHSGSLSNWMKWLLLLSGAVFMLPAVYVGYRK